MLIIPRTPSPEPLEHRDIDSMTEDEVRRALREARAAGARPRHSSVKQEVKREVKRERGDASDESKPAKRPRRSSEPTETVDLTDDAAVSEVAARPVYVLDD